MGIAQDTWIEPDWPAPGWVRAGTTTRKGGVSHSPYDTMNLSDQVDDQLNKVIENRNRLKRAYNLPDDPYWLKQVHGNSVVQLGSAAHPDYEPVRADASFTDVTGVVCAVLTADCLPVLLCDRCGTRVAAVHAGWRGLRAGVIDAAVTALAKPGEELMAWLGPAIGPDAFVVGEEVRQEFLGNEWDAQDAFRVNPEGGWRADIYQLARLCLAHSGVRQIYGGSWCTYSDVQRFYSYRRDGETGRMASLIWLTARMD